MKKRSEIGIGDAVEIKGYMHDKGETVEIWRPATVSSKSIFSLGVTFADHQRLAVPLHASDQWRPAPDPVVEQGIETKWGFFTVGMLERLRTAYDKAVADGNEQFDELGTTWLVMFVKHLFVYAESQGVKV